MLLQEVGFEQKGLPETRLMKYINTIQFNIILKKTSEINNNYILWLK